jgi:hypothetical protein
MHAGLGRSRSAAHAMLGSVCAIAVAMLVYFVCGFSWQGFAAGPAHVVTVAGKHGTGLRPNRSSFEGCNREGFRGLAGGVAADVQRGPGGADSAGRRNRPLAIGRRVRIHGSSGRLHIPDIRALGLGRRVAGATGRELRPGARLFGCRRRRVAFKPWAASRPGRSPAFWDPGGASTPWTGRRQPSPATTPCWFCWAVSWRCWGGWPELRRLSCCSPAPRRERGGGGHRHRARGRHGCADGAAITRARFGGRMLPSAPMGGSAGWWPAAPPALSHPGGGGHDWAGGRCAGHVLGGVAGYSPGSGRPGRLHFGACHRRYLGRAGAGHFRPHSRRFRPVRGATGGRCDPARFCVCR